MPVSVHNKKLIIFIPLNLQPTAKQYETHYEWLEQRISRFLNTTAKSLSLQHISTFMAFTAYVVYQPATHDIIQSILSHYLIVDHCVNFISSDLYEQTLKEYVQDTTSFCELHLSSDDLISPNTVSYLFTLMKRHYQAILYPMNYLYDTVSGSLYECTMPPLSFYALLYQTKDYLQGKRYNITSEADLMALKTHPVKACFFIKCLHAYNSFFTQSINELSHQMQATPFILGKQMTDFHEKKKLIDKFSYAPPMYKNIHAAPTIQKVIFKIPFNLPILYSAQDILSPSRSPVTSPSWIKDHLARLMSGTLKSLLAQANTNFTAYILFYEATESIVLQELAKYPPLPSHIRFIRAEDYPAFLHDAVRYTQYFIEVEGQYDDFYQPSLVQYLSSYKINPDIYGLTFSPNYIHSKTSSSICWVYPTPAYLKSPYEMSTKYGSATDAHFMEIQ